MQRGTAKVACSERLVVESRLSSRCSGIFGSVFKATVDAAIASPIVVERPAGASGTPSGILRLFDVTSATSSSSGMATAASWRGGPTRSRGRLGVDEAVVEATVVAVSTAAWFVDEVTKCHSTIVVAVEGCWEWCRGGRELSSISEAFGVLELAGKSCGAGVESQGSSRESESCRTLGASCSRTEKWSEIDGECEAWAVTNSL